MARSARISYGMHALIRKELEWCQEEFYKGNRLAILYAIQRSCRYGVPLPEMLADQVVTAMRQRAVNTTETLDQILGIAGLPKMGTRQRRWFAVDASTGENLIFRVIKRRDEIEAEARSRNRRSKVTTNRRQLAEEFGLSERTVLDMITTAAKMLKGGR